MNILYGGIQTVIIFSLVVFTEKLFKREGLYVWLSIAIILANITVCKMIDIFHYTTSLGNVLFASIFLATDIMSEKYSEKDAKKGVYISVFSGIIFIIVTQLTLLFIPSSEDVVHDAMKVLFTISIRTMFASMFMFFISNMLDIKLYNYLKKKIPEKMWLRNNISTILCNCIENYFFNTLAFIGIFPMSVIISIATTTTVIEIVIALCDTPFLYLSKRLK